MKFTKINKCRCCSSNKLASYINFGNMSLTTEFPKKKIKNIIPMNLIICKKCKLFQLLHNYDLKKLYNKDYGYKSGINKTMVKHLKSIFLDSKNKCELKKNDIILDIASNDGTLLKNFKLKGLKKIGIDPIVNKFKEIYNKQGILGYPGLFDKKIFLKLSKGEKAKIITTIAVFYDIQEPNKFVSDIKNILEDDGIWIMEQSYFPFLIKNNAFDSICHEHLSYFMFKQLKIILDKNNLNLIDAKFNEMNGGSIRLFIAHKNSKYKINMKSLKALDSIERNIFKNLNFHKKKFKKNIYIIKKNLVKMLKNIKIKKKVTHIYGASTKGNVLLQYCRINKNLVEYAVERNPDKFGRFTPGTFIPIISEKVSRKMKPNYYLVMPWHFKNEIMKREKKFMKTGGKLIFPLPSIKLI